MVFSVLWQWTLQNFSPFSTGQVQGGFLQVLAPLLSASLTVSSAILAVPPGCAGRRKDESVLCQIAWRVKERSCQRSAFSVQPIQLRVDLNPATFVWLNAEG